MEVVEELKRSANKPEIKKGMVSVVIPIYGSFDIQRLFLTIESIKNQILDPNDISGIIGDYNISEEQIFTENQGNYDLYNRPIVYGKTGNETVIAHQGWIIVVPYSNMIPQGIAETSTAGTLVYRGTIYLKPGAGGGGYLPSHEFGHMFIGSGHPEIMPPNQTVMSTISILQTTGPADKKAGKLIYEQTYMTFSGILFPELDYLYNILGPGFYGEIQITGTIIGNPFEAEEDDKEDFTEEQQNSTENNIIGSDDTDSSNSRYVASSNSNSARLVRTYRGTIAYRETIYLQPGVGSNGRVVSYESNPLFIGGEHSKPISLNEKTVVTPLSNIIQKVLQIKNQVISFISQKLKSTFAIYLN